MLLHGKSLLYHSFDFHMASRQNYVLNQDLIFDGYTSSFNDMQFLSNSYEMPPSIIAFANLLCFAVNFEKFNPSFYLFDDMLLR